MNKNEAAPLKNWFPYRPNTIDTRWDVNSRFNLGLGYPRR